MTASRYARCRCGHARYWHQTLLLSDPPRTVYGQCEITGPQPEDGCNCTGFVEASDG